jgi:hypothetical protein
MKDEDFVSFPFETGGFVSTGLDFYLPNGFLNISSYLDFF